MRCPECGSSDVESERVSPGTIGATSRCRYCEHYDASERFMSETEFRRRLANNSLPEKMKDGI